MYDHRWRFCMHIAGIRCQRTDKAILGVGWPLSYFNYLALCVAFKNIFRGWFTERSVINSIGTNLKVWIINITKAVHGSLDLTRCSCICWEEGEGLLPCWSWLQRRRRRWKTTLTPRNASASHTFGFQKQVWKSNAKWTFCVKQTYQPEPSAFSKLISG